jgi:hypothetical protein
MEASGVNQEVVGSSPVRRATQTQNGGNVTSKLTRSGAVRFSLGVPNARQPAGRTRRPGVLASVCRSTTPAGS